MKRYIKGFNENHKINENLSERSESDLTSFRDELNFINEYDVETKEIIEIVDKILKMTWDEIKKFRKEIKSTRNKSDKEKITIRIIDRYCSND